MAEVLREDLLQRLYDIAADQGRSVNALVEEVVKTYTPVSPDDPAQYPVGSFQRLAAGGRNMPMFEVSHDVSSRADEILQDEFAEYLTKRMNENAADSGG